MTKIFSNKNGNTYLISEAPLKDINHETMQISDYKISQYGQIFSDDQIKELLEKTKSQDTLVVGTSIYWYTVSRILKVFIDRFYMLPEAKARIYIYLLKVHFQMKLQKRLHN